ncbi:hypothetical protein N7539_008748 [Penicillium diatomitis]|uniref:Uncharacterized protein n=1 Tax=Penicillium diatomitis TaxID=2819901 RepID=A0A9W9WQG3_9EURO|nr:uncharacterized protein N7539_008748 [Penicillium diatomitis]KAJ5471805.1 hypothetical protein N7539_008748 [Penicillium diatomitis]
MVNSDINIASLGQCHTHSGSDISHVLIDELLGKGPFHAFVTGLSARVQEGNLETMILGFTYRTDFQFAAYRQIQHILDPHDKEATSTVKPFGLVETPITASDNDLPKYTSSLFVEA